MPVLTCANSRSAGVVIRDRAVICLKKKNKKNQFPGNLLGRVAVGSTKQLIAEQ